MSIKNKLFETVGFHIFKFLDTVVLPKYVDVREAIFDSCGFVPPPLVTEADIEGELDTDPRREGLYALYAAMAGAYWSIRDADPLANAEFMVTNVVAEAGEREHPVVMVFLRDRFSNRLTKLELVEFLENFVPSESITIEHTH